MPVQITAKKDGFRRAGVAHPAVMTEYEDGTFTDEQLAQLKAEPMLTVKVIKTKKDNGSKDAAPVADTKTQKLAAQEDAQVEMVETQEPTHKAAASSGSEV